MPGSPSIRRIVPLLLAAGPAIGGAAPRACAQAIPFSQRASVTQMLGTTELVVRYGRPTARGRRLFGGVVRWGQIWNPGADSATTLSVSAPVRIEGELLPAGSYSIWVVPDSAGPWTVIFSRASAVFHTPYPGDEHDALRLRVQPTAVEHMENLSFYFPLARAREGVLRLHWGTTALALRVEARQEP